MTDPDATLVQKTAEGDRDALESIVTRYESAVFRLAKALTGNDAAAEDVLQETFLAVWRHAGTYDGTGSVRAWILTVARNAARRHFRRHAGEPAEVASLSQLGEAAGWGSDELPLGDRVANAQLVQIGLHGLEEEEREILLLREVEGFSGEETARMLGVSLAAMKSRLHRARLHFMANVREKSHA